MTFELEKDVYGEVILQIYLEDDGEAGEYGSSASHTILYPLKILNSVVELRIEIVGV